MNTLWQHPYVNIFRHFEVDQWKKSAKEGDVSACMDKYIKCTVYRIAGVIPANNYIQLPKTGSQSLGLTGRYVYIAFKPIPERYFVAHLDAASTDGLVIRISFSNLFKEFKSTSTWLQFPFIVTPCNDTVDYQTSCTTKTVEPGAAPTTTRWTLLVLDLKYILSIYLNRTYSHVKTMRMCANTLVKGVYTSDNFYEPGICHADAKRAGLSERGVEALPKELSFPLGKSENWHEKYDLIRFPCDSNKNPVDSLQKLGMPGLKPSNKSIGNKNSDYIPPQSAKTEKISLNTEKTKINFVNAKSAESKVLPEVGLDDQIVDQQENKQITAFQPREVHVVSKSSKDFKANISRPIKISDSKSSKRIPFPVDDDIKESTKPGYKVLQPDPILKLRKVVGFGGASMNQALWTQGGNCIVYPCHALVVSINVCNGKQRFFIGHTEKISCISLTRDCLLLASGQTGQNCCVRIWNYKTSDCLSVFKVSASALISLSFAESGSILAVSGRDNHNKALVAVWNTSRVAKGGDVNLIAKAHTEADITTLKVSPADECRMVSCGRNNIRLWRLKDNSLRSAAVPLGEHHTMEFTDVCWDYEPTAVADIRRTSPDDRKIFACSRSGHIFEIDHKKMCVSDVHRLLPRKKDGEKQTIASGSGISVNSIYANDTFCITGSSDGFLRVWPLDFKHIYLEAEHDGPVSVVQMSDNGLKILAATSSGNLGVLDVTTRTHQNLIRSHTDKILHFSQDVFRHHLATVSADHTIRVWALDTGQQLYDFHSPNECPVCICYHPSRQVIAVGFDSGAVRIFDIQGTCLIADHCSHKGAVTGLAYTPDGNRLFSAASDGTLASYDSSDDSYPVIRLLGGTVVKGAQYGPDALSVSPHGHYVAFVGPQNFTITVVGAKTLDEVMKIDITTVTSPAEAARGAIDTARKVYYTPSNTGHLIVTTESSRLLKFDASTGKLLSEVGNIHREPCGSLDISRSGKHLITAGDKLVKVWDYQMRYDLNFQVYIGQSESISKVSFTPSYKEVISCGEAVFIWQFLAGLDDSEEESHDDSSIDETLENKVLTADVSSPTLKSSVNLLPSQDKRTDDRIGDVSHNDLPRQTIPFPLSPEKPNTSITSASLAVLTPYEAQKKKCITDASYMTPKTQENNGVLKPSVKKHFIATDKVASFATKRYVATEGQAGLKLKACIGYNGNGRDNLIWQPETGLFAYSCGSVIVIEDLKTGEQKHLMGHVEEISTMAFQSDCLEMASASGSREQTSSQLCLWDLNSMTCRRVINDHDYNIVSLAYSRDDRFLVSLGDYKERRISVWETSTCNLVATTITNVPMHYVAWDPQAFNEFVTVGDKASVMFWLVDEITDKAPKLRVNEPKLPDEVLDLAPKIDFTCVAYAGDKMLYIGSSIGVVTVWETKKNTCVLHWEADKCEITSIMAKRGHLITGSSNKKCLRLWSVTGVSELVLPGSNSTSNTSVEVEDEMSLDGYVTAMVFDDSLDMGVVGTDAGTVWYINWQEHSCIRLVTTNQSIINDLQLSADNKFVTCADDGSIRIWSLDDREQMLQLQVLDQRCTCAAFSPSFEKSHIYGQKTPATFTVNGKQSLYTYLAAGYSDGTLRVFDINKAEMLIKVQPHRTCMTDVIFGSASMLISGDDEGFIALTNTLTGMTVRVINDHKGVAIHNFDVANWKSPEGLVYWLACSSDRRVSVWVADWSKDSCVLQDWLTFPAPVLGPNQSKGSKNAIKEYYSSLPPSIAKFSTIERDVILYTGYGMTKSVQFYNLITKTVTKNFPLTHWARSLDISPLGSLVAVGINERLVKIHDYTEGTFQDYIGSDDAVRLIKFTNDGRYLISVVNKCLFLWDVLL